MFKLSVALFALLSLGAILAPPAAADDSKASVVVFDTWVEIPGAVLPGGSYIFKLEGKHDHEKVQIFDKVSGIYITTVPASAVTSQGASDEGVRLEARAFPNHKAVEAWFPQGSQTGAQFTYPPNEGNFLFTKMIYPPGVDAGSLQVASANQEAAQPAPLPAQPTPPTATAPVEAAPITEPGPPAVETPPAAIPNAAAPNIATPNSATPDTGLSQQPPVTPQATAPATPPEPSGVQPSGPEGLPKTASKIPLGGAIAISVLALAGILSLCRRYAS